MMRSFVLLLAVIGTAMSGVVASPVSAGPEDVRTATEVQSGLPRSPELPETRRLPDRRSIVTADRFYAVGTEDGLYPAAGFHTSGEMGGFWTPPIKLLDGMWFALGDAWLGKQAPATRFTSGWGYTRTEYGPTSGIRAERTDFAPNGLRAGLVGLTLTSDRSTEATLTLDAHSELMNAYPWGETTPSQSDFNLPDTGDFTNNALVFREQGTPPTPNAGPHDYSAVVGSTLPVAGHRLGPDFRGPQTPPVICPATGDKPVKCDDSAFGKGTGGQLTYRVPLEASIPRTVWFAVAGSDQNAAEAQEQYEQALADPVGLLRSKLDQRQQVAGNTVVDLPGDDMLQRSVEWSKQNLADSPQEARDLQLRETNEGERYPVPSGTLSTARWLGAGWPDYPWLFGTDGEYTAFASVAMGQFDDIKAHLRSLKDVSEVVNDRSGKVVHEVTPDGSVYYGTNEDPGNTDESSKFPSAVALVWRWTADQAFLDEMYDFSVRSLKFIDSTLDADHDGWPEGNGNVERPGMGAEKLDNAAYTMRGFRDLADMARSKNDTATADLATSRAEDLEKRFESTWWAGGDTQQYGDSLQEPTDAPNLQRHWIGVTPMDSEMVRPGQPTHPLASVEHGTAALQKRQEDCYSGEFGLYHTGTGPTSAEGGNKGPTCDSAVSSVQSERSVYSLNTGIMAVAQGNFGRLGLDQQQRYTTANARIQLDPSVWELPGAMPEIAPSPDSPPNIDRPLTERSMALQAWGAYGTLWPVVHHQLGVAPDMGRNQLSVVPQVPDGQERVAGRNIRLAAGSIDVEARRNGKTLTTAVQRSVATELSIGHVLPPGSKVVSATLDGRAVPYRLITTARGQEVVADAARNLGRSTLVVTLD